MLTAPMIVAVAAAGAVLYDPNTAQTLVPVVTAAAGYGLGSFELCGLFDDPEAPPPPGTVLCEQRAFRQGVTYAVIGGMAGYILVSMTKRR